MIRLAALTLSLALESLAEVDEVPPDADLPDLDDPGVTTDPGGPYRLTVEIDGDNLDGAKATRIAAAVLAEVAGDDGPDLVVNVPCPVPSPGPDNGPGEWCRPTDGATPEEAAEAGCNPPTFPSPMRWDDRHPADPPNPDGSTTGAWIPAESWPWSTPNPDTGGDSPTPPEAGT